MRISLGSKVIIQLCYNYSSLAVEIDIEIKSQLFSGVENELAIAVQVKSCSSMRLVADCKLMKVAASKTEQDLVRFVVWIRRQREISCVHTYIMHDNMRVHLVARSTLHNKKAKS